MATITTWLLAVRPKTLFAGLCPVLFGSSLSLSLGVLNPWLFCATLLTALGIQISTNLANDYFDYIKGADTKQRKGPTRITQAGLVSLSTMKKAIILSFSITALIGSVIALQGGLVITGLLILSLLLALAYTAGPYPLAYKGFGDLFVLIFFGPVATLGTYWIQTHTLSKEALIGGLGLGLLSTAILCINNLRDVEEDKVACKKTLVVRLGTRFGKLEYILCLTLAFLIPFYFYPEKPWSLLTLICAPLAIFWIKKTKDHPNLLLAHTGKLLFLYTLLLSLGWIL